MNVFESALLGGGGGWCRERGRGRGSLEYPLGQGEGWWRGRGLERGSRIFSAAFE